MTASSDVGEPPDDMNQIHFELEQQLIREQATSASEGFSLWSQERNTCPTGAISGSGRRIGVAKFHTSLESVCHDSACGMFRAKVTLVDLCGKTFPL